MVDKQTINSVVKIVVSLLGLLWAAYNAPKGATKGLCPEDWVVTPRALSKDTISRTQFHRAECFFPEDYEQGSVNFVAAATAAGAELSSMPIGVEDLRTDVAIFRKNADPAKFLVHISGTHGPESYIGSAVQNILLQHIKQYNLYADAPNTNTSTSTTDITTNTVEATTDENGDTTTTTTTSTTTPTTSLPPTLIFVHALNPYGFKHHRRVNEENIDLNRNFLTPSEREYVDALHPNYARHIDLQDVINPTSRPFTWCVLNDLFAYVQSGYMIYQYGMHTLKTALVAGNYINPSGYSYGGRTYSTSARNLMHLLIDELQIPTKAAKFALIDVHTGLGPSGVDTLLGLDSSTDAQLEKQRSELIERYFPVEENHKQVVVGGLKPASTSAEGDLVNKGYELTKGTVSGSFCSQMLGGNLSEENKMCLTQEFGTVSPTTVGLTMIADNYAYHHGTDVEKAYYAQKVKGCFYVETKDWKRRTAHRGLMVFFQAFDYLSRPDDSTAEYTPYLGSGIEQEQ